MIEALSGSGTVFAGEVQKPIACPHHRLFQVLPAVEDAIFSLRDTLKSRYGRVVGAKTFHQDEILQRDGGYLPCSARTVW
jgi:hypothetical protein